MRGLKIFIKVSYRSYIINLTAAVLKFIEAAYKKAVLENFAKFTGKHLCQILLFCKVTGPEA